MQAVADFSVEPAARFKRSDRQAVALQAVGFQALALQAVSGGYNRWTD
jgi:hypothetical protein